MGLSDRVQVAMLEERMDDVRAVMDAVGSERAALLGVSEGGPMSLMFAATYPDRTLALLLCGAERNAETSEYWPWGEQTREEFEEYILTLPDHWADPFYWSSHFAPDIDPETARRFDELGCRLLPESASPGAAVAVQRMAFEVDARDLLPSIRARRRLHREAVRAGGRAAPSRPRRETSKAVGARRPDGVS